VDDVASERRFVHEARAASQVVHDHLVPLLDVGEWQGRRYIAMRYIEGRSLEQRLASEGPLPVPDVIRLGEEIGSALGALHEVGLVHRDVKPGNILLAPDGSAHLTDFGLAKGTDFSSLTRPGTIVGTLDYLAPERIRGAPATPSSDIYALGVVLFEALAGHTPFSGRSLMEVGWEILERDPPDPCAGRSDGSRHLCSAVLLALAKDPEARPKTAPLYARLVRVAARMR
jgi:serine/threonine-protein kinase